MEPLLLHVCCGPCSAAPLRLLDEKGSNLAAYFFNPNIVSREEYDLRAETFRCFAESMGLEVVVPPWEPGEWSEAIAPYAGLFPLITGSAAIDDNRMRREQRCRACYRFRFERLAAVASARAYKAISTTLSISPYQFTDAIKEELTEAARRHSVEPIFDDYRSFYSESVQKSRELGMYRQNFCGCLYSKEEAELERSARKTHKAPKSETLQDVSYG